MTRKLSVSLSLLTSDETASVLRRNARSDRGCDRPGDLPIGQFDRMIRFNRLERGGDPERSAGHRMQRLDGLPADYSPVARKGWSRPGEVPKEATE